MMCSRTNFLSSRKHEDGDSYYCHHRSRDEYLRRDPKLFRGKKTQSQPPPPCRLALTNKQLVSHQQQDRWNYHEQDVQVTCRLSDHVGRESVQQAPDERRRPPSG